MFDEIMFIFLYGSDTYRSKEKLKDIIERYRKIHKSGLSLIILDIKENNFQDFDNCLRSVSIFQEKKLIILKNSFSDPDFKEKFLKKKKDYKNSEDIIVFFEETLPSKNNSLFKFLKENGKSQEFSLLTGQKLKNWVKKEFENNHSKIEPEALEELINFIGNDLWSISNEIKKLSAFAKTLSFVKTTEGRPSFVKTTEGRPSLAKAPSFAPFRGATEGKSAGKGKIKKEDVELLVRPKIDTDIFKTIDALAEKNKKKALFLIHKHLEKGDSPFYLLTMINYQFRNLLTIKSQTKNYIGQRETISLSRELELHPFVVRKSGWQIQKFSLDELKKIYQKIFQADYNIKTGKINPETALDLLIAQI